MYDETVLYNPWKCKAVNERQKKWKTQVFVVRWVNGCDCGEQIAYVQKTGISIHEMYSLLHIPQSAVYYIPTKLMIESNST